MLRRTLLRAAPAALMTAYLPAVAARAATPKGDAAFVALRDRYFLGVMRFNPVTATYLGGDGYSPQLADINSRLRDVSAAGIAREKAFYREIKAANDAIRPEGLSREARIDRAVMTAQLNFILHQLETLRYYERAVDTYVAEPFRGVDWQMQQMADAGSGLLGTAAEWRLLETRVRAIPVYLAAAGANLKAGAASGNIPDWRMVERDGVNGARTNAAYFRKTLPDQAAGYLGRRPFAARALADLKAACDVAAKAWEDFAVLLSQTFPPGEAKDRFAIGEAEYAWRVRNNLNEARTPAELYAYGQSQTAAYQAKIFAVAKVVTSEAGLNLPYGTAAEKNAGVRAAMDLLSQDSPKTDAELRQWYVDTGKRAVQYGREQQLFDIPADYRLDVIDTPEVLRSTTDASYYPAPPFKSSGIGRFYLTPTGEDAAALKLNNRASVADTAVHEGFPGHDWHYKFMSLHPKAISNIRWLPPGAVEDSSSMWEDSMAAEGWGLYAEELMSEPTADRPYGFYTAGEYLYELQGQLMRAVRIVVDVGIHTGRMTFDEAVDYFAANVSFNPGACGRAASDPEARAVCENARRAMYRYSKWPTQAITYNLGKTAILELRAAYKAAKGASYTAKGFHERLMGMGTIPASYFREDFLASARG